MTLPAVFLFALAAAALTACVSSAKTPIRTPAAELALNPGFLAVPSRAVGGGLEWTQAERSSLNAALDDVRGTYLDGAGLAVVDEDGTLLYGRHAARGYAPASTLKLIVAAAALGTLGPKATLATSFQSLGGPDAQGRVGDVWLVGNGDPVFDIGQLRAGIGMLARRGVRQIGGNLIVDATAFTGPEQNPKWASDDFENGYAAGTSALSLNWNVIEFKIAPTVLGRPARVQVFPLGSPIVVTGTVTTGYGTDLHIDRVAPGRNEFVVGGTIAPGGELSFYRPAAQIAQWVGEIAGSLLRERSIVLDGTVVPGSQPFVGQTLWEHRSPALTALLRQMLYESDNHIAEQLLRLVGAGAGAGSSASGARAERAYLLSLGVPLEGLRVVDGSGLAEANRVAPLTLARLLIAQPTLFDLLPRAGIEGTVRHHQLTSSLGRVRAKSGHIDGVNALAGYVETRHHGRVAFALLVNAPDADDAISIQIGIDRALDRISEL
ncbi:MAG: D-alanyl-D-alanine carboxypeptidase/D-alanyl-D-alanine-endopeptidase [Candidatus Eremiobacteraeota bacterium]|nr:D-alanyl-D-alanine carboxypeptidase/D-alanyl-D-alanine-endopeptidase [Candidatus Eremiobacteraeota bacterium]